MAHEIDFGRARPGTAWLGVVRRGVVRHGRVRRGAAGLGRARVPMAHGIDVRFAARRGEARFG
jgi:hypothetical protein